MIIMAPNRSAPIAQLISACTTCNSRHLLLSIEARSAPGGAAHAVVAAYRCGA
jgi:hypothetical protein